MHAESEFLAHIRVNPDDDAPRLIFADYLDEQEDPRAEFIRTFCKKAMRRDHPGDVFYAVFRAVIPERNCWHCWHADRMDVVVMEYSGPNYVQPGGKVEFRRGFIESVACTSADWLAHGPAIVARHPVQRVTLTDRRPYFQPGASDRGAAPADWDAMWAARAAENSPWHLPPSIYDRLPKRYFRFEDYGDAVTPEDAAMDALSTACISWALRKAGIDQPTQEEFRGDAVHERQQREKDERYPASLVPRSFTTQTF